MKRNRRRIGLAFGTILVVLVGLLAVLVPYEPILVPGPTIEATALSLSKP